MTITTTLREPGYSTAWFGDFIGEFMAKEVAVMFADYEVRGGGWYRYKGRLLRGRNALRDAVWSDR